MADRAARTARNNASQLLQLPGELRNRIYEYAFTDKTSYTAVEIVNPTSRTWRTNKPGLIDACGQLRREASPYFYSNTIFVLTPENGLLGNHVSEDAIMGWTDPLGQYARLVQKVGIAFNVTRRCNGSRFEKSCYILASLASSPTTSFTLSNKYGSGCDCYLATETASFNAEERASTEMPAAALLYCNKLLKLAKCRYCGSCRTCGRDCYW